MAARATTQFYDLKFKKVKLTATQVILLNCVKEIGPLTISELSDAVSTDRTTVTRNILPLRRRGFLKIQKGPDRREKKISLTDKGYASLSKGLTIWEKAQDEIHQVVGKRSVEKLNKDIAAIVSKVQQIA